MTTDYGGTSLRFTNTSKEVLRNWARWVKGDYDVVERKWLVRMAAWMLREGLKAFDDQKQGGGAAWAPLNAKYAEWKLEHGKSGLANILTGAMRRSISQEMNRGRGLVRVGSPKEYSIFTEEGTKTGMPARPFLPAKNYAEEHARSLFNELCRRYMN